MRSRNEIMVDGTRKDILSLEVLLDIRQILLNKDQPVKKPRGRPKKVKRECVK